MSLSKNEREKESLNDSDICIVIPTFNNEKTIASIIKRTLRFTYQIIIIDDGCTDRTHVLPKKDFMLRKGSIYMEITQRISPTDLSFGMGYRQSASAFHQYYLKNFELICKRKEKTAYYLPYINYKYMYKGVSVEMHCRKMLKKSPLYEKYIDADYSDLHHIWIMA